MADDAPDARAVSRCFKRMQARLCRQLEQFEPQARFGEDAWRHAHGSGMTRVIEHGAVFEKGGVNFSEVSGSALPPAATTRRTHLAGKPFQASGVSLVMHPRNPYVPCCHMNLRFFLAGAPGGEAVWWFGGGYDLTPCYAFDEDCIHWHQTAKRACDRFGPGHYARFKAWCDRYFHLKHRGETRGIGGLFFDDYREGGFERAFAFAREVGGSFIEAYAPIVQRRRGMRYTERQRLFQFYRRGRYVEFNLVFDRGTLFGLQSGGRAESILMSMPPVAHWKYDWRAEPGSDEARLVERYLKPRDWLGAAQP